MKKLLLCCALFVFWVPQAARAVGPGQECVPSCRSGYMCIDGACVEKCNPPCADNEFCNRAGECMPKDRITPVSFGERGPSHWFFGLSAGVLLPHDKLIWNGEVGRYFSNEAGFALNLTADVMLARHFILGGYLLYINTATTASDEAVHMLSTGFTMKFPVYIGNRFQVRPGLGFGPGFVLSDLLNQDAIGINPFLCIQFVLAVTENISLNFEYSFMSMPWSEEDRVTFPPLSMLRLGVEFGE